MTSLTALVQPALDRIRQRTRELVEIDSGSYDAAGVDAVAERMDGYLAELGFASRRTFIGEGRGAFFTASLEIGEGPGLLLLGHADTVWPRGTAAEWRFHDDGTSMTGPGAGDMKCALVMAVEATRAALAHRPDCVGRIDVGLVPDEELGSVGSRGVIEELGHAADLCLTLEAGRPDGGLITSRGAVGAMTVTVHGRTAHATEPGGVSALRAAAPLIAQLERLSDRSARVLCTVGILRSGTARQVVPDLAELHVDLRAPDNDRLLALAEQTREVAASAATDGARVEAAGGLTRPALLAERSAPAYAKASALAAADGWRPFRVAEMGGSDGSFVAHLGVVTLDGLGPIAHEQCSRRESVDVASIVPRTTLLAGLIAGARDIALAGSR